MIEKVWKYIEQEHMIEEGDCVVAGVSGGADSVCLLLVLLELRKKIAMDLRAVHINHLIREDAAKDAAYVEQLCFAHNIPFTLVEEDVEKLAQDFVNDLANSLRERMLDLMSGMVVFVGGGAILLRRQIEASGKVRNALFVEEIHANAKGYEFLYKMETGR